LLREEWRPGAQGKIVGDRRCRQAIEGLPDPWPDPAHREAVAAASGQVEGKTMATVGRFAKVPRWHWSVGMARTVNAKTRLAAGSARTDNGGGHTTAGLAEIGAA